MENFEIEVKVYGFSSFSTSRRAEPLFSYFTRMRPTVGEYIRKNKFNDTPEQILKIESVCNIVGITWCVEVYVEEIKLNYNYMATSVDDQSCVPTQPSTVDHRELLKKYLTHVGNAEGTTFLNSIGDAFSPEEEKELRAIDRESDSPTE